MGTVYSKVGKYDEAIKYLEKGLSIAIEIGDKSGEGTGLWDLGTVYSKVGKYDEAIEYLEKGLSIAIDIGDKDGEGTGLWELGNSLQQSRKIRRSHKVSRKGTKHCHRDRRQEWRRNRPMGTWEQSTEK